MSPVIIPHLTGTVRAPASLMSVYLNNSCDIEYNYFSVEMPAILMLCTDNSSITGNSYGQGVTVAFQNYGKSICIFVRTLRMGVLGT